MQTTEAGQPIPSSQHNKRWHACEPKEVEQALATTLAQGLDAAAACARLVENGPNQLEGAPGRSAWGVFLAQFRSSLIVLLLGAAALAALVGNVKDASVILAVVVFNAAIGFWQEWRAERSLESLQHMLPQHCHVRRGGKRMAVQAQEVVAGDIVLIEAGDRVPADGRLLATAELEIDESALTGESLPVAKTAAVTLDSDAAAADRVNMAYMNSIVTRGRGEMAVSAVGMNTEIGKLSRQLAAAQEPPSPLQVQLDQLGKRLGVIAMVLVAILFALELLRGEPLVRAVLEAIALAVAAVPEGLPAVVTVTLALGMHKLARQRAIVKRLASVETLGCTTVICSDKTGTLTVNQMTVRAAYFRGERLHATGAGYCTEGVILGGHADTPRYLDALLVPLVCCNDSRLHDGRAIGDPTEAALLAFAAKGGLDCEEVQHSMPRMAEVPFDSANKFMATVHEDDGALVMYVKGAPDVLLPRCGRWLAPNDEAQMDEQSRTYFEKTYYELASAGLRGLLVARRQLGPDPFSGGMRPLDCVQDLTLVGLIGLMDPPRAEAREAIATCRDAGIAVKMITGDHRVTGLAIARELGLHGEALTGRELDRMSAAELSVAIGSVSVFARVTPVHKVKIVQALRAQGHVVAMTGDGVNDAPALKTADIGIAMGGSGTDVAKEAASMVLTDDNFATIVSAVRQGRALYDNILKFVRFQLSTTVGAILTVFMAPLLGLPEPFTAIQILWVALIMDGPPAVSLAFDRARPGLMQEPPRVRGAPVLPLSRVARIVAYGMTMAAGSLGVLHYSIASGDADIAPTLCFTTFVLFQFFNIFNARVERGTAFNVDFFRNGMLWCSLAAVAFLQAVAVQWSPAQEIFGTRDLSLAQWAIAVAVASTVLVFEEVRKAVPRLGQRPTST